MAISIQKHAEQIRKLCDEYYHRNIEYDQYAVQRNLILDTIESEMTGGVLAQTTQMNNIINAVKSYVRKITPVE